MDETSRPTHQMATRNKSKREVVLWVAGGAMALLGWTRLEHTARIAVMVLGCAYQIAPLESGSKGGCLGTSWQERAVVEVAGMATTIAGGIVLLIAALNHRRH